MASINAIRPLNQDWLVYAGDNWKFTATLYVDDTQTTPYDLSVYTEIKLEIKDKRTDATALVESDLASGEIKIGGVGSNELSVNVPGAKMDVLEARTYQYDIEASGTGDVTTLIEGMATATADVVKDE